MSSDISAVAVGSWPLDELVPFGRDTLAKARWIWRAQQSCPPLQPAVTTKSIASPSYPQQMSAQINS
jgi:hypothetical protein